MCLEMSTYDVVRAWGFVDTSGFHGEKGCHVFLYPTSNGKYLMGMRF